MRILHRGRHLSPDQKISDIENLHSHDQLHVVKTEPRRPEPRPNPPPLQGTYRLNIPQPQFRAQLQNFVNENRRAARPAPYNNPRNSSNARYNNCAILYRNFEACVRASMNGQNPADRIRYNDPETESPAEPTASDLGQHVRALANTVRNWALELNRLSDELIRDVEVPAGSREREELRRLIQNNMDAARYFHPHLQNFTQFCVPLNMDAPRPLFTTEMQQARQDNQNNQN
jgi:hypothetical protein